MPAETYGRIKAWKGRFGGWRVDMGHDWKHGQGPGMQGRKEGDMGAYNHIPSLGLSFLALEGCGS